MSYFMGHLSITRRISKRFPLHSFYSKFGTHEFGRAVLEEQCVIKEVANWRNIFLHRCKDTNSISKFLVAEFETFPFLLVGEKQGRDCSISCVAPLWSTPLWSTKLFLISSERGHQSMAYRKSQKEHLLNLSIYLFARMMKFLYMWPMSKNYSIASHLLPVIPKHNMLCRSCMHSYRINLKVIS